MSEQDYGINGSVMIDSWKRQYDEIAGHVKFGGADANAFLPLMQKISDHMDEQYLKREKWNKFGLVMVCASVVAVLSAGLFSDPSAWLVLVVICIALTVMCFKMKKARENEILAAIDFDKAYFDGEIVYRRKNG